MVLLIVLVVHLLETKRGLRNLCRHEIQIISTRMTLMKLAFNNKVLDGYQRGLPSMVYKFFDKKSTGSGTNSISNQQFANELHTHIHQGQFWGVDLGGMQLTSK